MFILVYHNIIVSSNDCKKVFFVVKYSSKETRIFFCARETDKALYPFKPFKRSARKYSKGYRLKNKAAKTANGG